MAGRVPVKFGKQFVVYDRTLVAALREIHGQETNLWTLHDQVEPAFIPADGLDLPALRGRARRLTEAQAADEFSESQLAHAGRLEAEREKLERYYRLQKGAVAPIAIEDIRRARQREFLEHRQDDLAVLEQRLRLILDLELVGTVMIAK